MSQAPRTEKPTLADMADRIRTLQLQKRQLNITIKDIDNELGDLIPRVMAEMDNCGLEAMKSGNASLAITEQRIPAVNHNANGEPDWDSVFQWISDTGSWYLLRKQLNQGGWEELEAMDELPPCIRLITKRSLSVTKR